jgi:hypothetical protein
MGRYAKFGIFLYFAFSFCVRIRLCLLIRKENRHVIQQNLNCVVISYFLSVTDILMQSFLVYLKIPSVAQSVPFE